MLSSAGTPSNAGGILTMKGLQRIRWRRRTVVQVMLAHAQLLFAGVFLQGLIPGTHIGNWLITTTLIVWAGTILSALSLDGLRGGGRIQ